MAAVEEGEAAAATSTIDDMAIAGRGGSDACAKKGEGGGSGGALERDSIAGAAGAVFEEEKEGWRKEGCKGEIENDEGGVLPSAPANFSLPPHASFVSSAKKAAVLLPPLLLVLVVRLEGCTVGGGGKAKGAKL